jgi:hypothetical protein
MKLDDIVLYAGRRYRLRGFDPVSVIPRRAYLEDVTTGAMKEVVWEEIKPLLQAVERVRTPPSGAA